MNQFRYDPDEEKSAALASLVAFVIIATVIGLVGLCVYLLSNS